MKAFVVMVCALMLLILFLIFGCTSDTEQVATVEDVVAAAPAAPQNNCPAFLYKNVSRMRWIPGGNFTMGDDDLITTDWHKTPEWTSNTTAYYIDMHEVTIGDFMLFMDMTGYQLHEHGKILDIEGANRNLMHIDVVCSCVGYRAETSLWVTMI